MAKCLVRDKGIKCSHPKYCRGQCQLHYSFFVRQIRDRRVTWDFLILSGEAEPPQIDTKAKNDRRKNILNSQTEGGTTREKKATSSRSTAADTPDIEKRVQMSDHRPGKKAANKTKKGKGK